MDVRKNAVRSKNAKLKRREFSTLQKCEIKLQRKISVLQYRPDVPYMCVCIYSMVFIEIHLIALLFCLQTWQVNSAACENTVDIIRIRGGKDGFSFCFFWFKKTKTSKVHIFSFFVIFWYRLLILV